MDMTELLRLLGLRQAYDAYQRNIGQPVANVAGPFGRGFLGLQQPEYGSEEAYRTGQAVGNMPAVAAPVGAFKAAMQVPELLAAMGAIAPKGARKVAEAIAEARTLKNAPQDEALEIARQNAVKMLGLPETNTAMDRARAMGFVGDVYHGSDVENIKKFDLTKNKRGEGVSVAISPENAQSYGKIIYPLLSNQQKIFDPTNKNQLTELKTYVDNYLKQQNPYDKDALSFYPFTSKQVFENLSNPQTGFLYLENDLITKALKDLGYSGSIGFEAGQKQLKIFDPSLIRSRFAAFDPARIKDKDLLASLAAMGIALPVGMGLLSEQTD